MGGERASTTRMRMAGKICAYCARSFKDLLEPGERLRERCQNERKPKRRIYMHFMLSDCWYIKFLEADVKTPLPKKPIVKSPDEIKAMIARVGVPMTTEQQQGFSYAIETGRGSAWLELTEEQYQKLRR